MKYLHFFHRKKHKMGDMYTRTSHGNSGVILNFDRAALLSAPVPQKWGQLVPQLTGAACRVELPRTVCSGQKLRWVSRETDEAGAPLTFRVPRQKNSSAHVCLPFCLAGRHYPHFGRFADRKEPGSDCFVDMYGRKVFHYFERFPCFDSYDYLCDHRRFHWFYLLEGEKLFRVYYADGSNILKISSDVAVIEEKCWNAMKKAGFLPE